MRLERYVPSQTAEGREGLEEWTDKVGQTNGDQLSVRWHVVVVFVGVQLGYDDTFNETDDGDSTGCSQINLEVGARSALPY